MQRHLTLLTDFLELSPGSHLLLSQVDDAELLASLGRQYRLSIFQSDYAATCRLRGVLGNHARITIHDRPIEDSEAKYDAAVLQIPKSRPFARALLFTALRALMPGARLYVIGPTHAGANTARTDAALLGRVRDLASRARHRLFVVDRPAELTPPEEWDQPWQRRWIEMSAAGQRYRVMTQPGIFSWDRVDEGTEFLIEHFPQLHDVPCRSILDAGCGYGLLGLAAERYFSPDHLVLADTDLLAVECARANVPTAKVVTHDLTDSPLAGEGPFDLILCNPPFHQGHEKDLSFMQRFPVQASRMLAPGGRLAIVANSFLPYRRPLAEHFKTVTPLYDNGRFQILVGDG
jgi:16S rRNA (guanine1207-N2)-methyltransferase